MRKEHVSTPEACQVGTDPTQSVHRVEQGRHLASQLAEGFQVTPVADRVKPGTRAGQLTHPSEWIAKYRPYRLCRGGRVLQHGAILSRVLEKIGEWGHKVEQMILGPQACSDSGAFPRYHEPSLRILPTYIMV